MVARWAAVILALVPPGVYADRLIAARAGQLSGEMASGRFVKARLLVLGLQEVGADPHSLIPVRLADLDASIQRLSDRVKHPLPPHTAPGRQIDRAFHLIQLDRLDEAAELLAPWAESEPAAAGLLLAGVRRDQKRWDEAIRTYESVLLRLPRDALEARTIAYQGLAEALIAGGRPDEAETVLSQALQEMPQQAAHWHWQLGNYYFRGGRPLLARQHLGKARDLSPQTMGPRVTPILDSIRRSTPGCLFR
jgi:tetratricopeptide (TPR) repeat protein